MLSKVYNYLWSLNDGLKDKIRKMGDHLQILCPAIFFCSVAFTGQWYLLVVSGITFLSCIGLYLLLNAIFNNTRPRETDELNFPPDMNVDWSPTIGNSFPSGHTMGAFAGGIWWLHYGLYFGIAGIVLGIFTGLSRVIAKAHWFRDVLTSMGIATILYCVAVMFFL